jgi:hypothetical protein
MDKAVLLIIPIGFSIHKNSVIPLSLKCAIATLLDQWNLFLLDYLVCFKKDSPAPQVSGGMTIFFWAFHWKN